MYTTFEESSLHSSGENCDTNLVKNHLMVIEILSFSCSVLLLVKADGNDLAVPNCKKKSKWLSAKIIVEPACG